MLCVCFVMLCRQRFQAHRKYTVIKNKIFKTGVVLSKVINYHCCVVVPVLGIIMNIIYGTVRSTLRQTGEIKRQSTNGTTDQRHRNVHSTPLFHITYRYTILGPSPSDVGIHYGSPFRTLLTFALPFPINCPFAFPTLISLFIQPLLL